MRTGCESRDCLVCSHWPEWVLLPESVAQSDGMAMIADCGVAAPGERGRGAADGSTESEAARSLPCMLMADWGGCRRRYYRIDAVPREKVCGIDDVVLGEMMCLARCCFFLVLPFVVDASNEQYGTRSVERM